MSLAASCGIIFHEGAEAEKLIEFHADTHSRRRVLSAVLNDTFSDLTPEELALRDAVVSQLGQSIISELRKSPSTLTLPSALLKFDFDIPLDVILQQADDRLLRDSAEICQALEIRFEQREDRCLSDAGVTVLEVLRDDDAVVAEGKGMGREASTLSALGEAIERFCLEMPDLADSFFGSQTQLETQDVLVPSMDLGTYDCFHRELPLRWLPGRTSRNEVVAIPADLVSTSIEPFGPAKVFAFQSTAGVACGPTPEFAAYRALAEVIETDAYALHVRLGVYDEQLEIDALGFDSSLGDLVECVQRQGIEIKAYLIQFDHLFPVVHCVLVNRNGRLPALAHGLGSGFSINAAMKTSLVEALQVFSDLTKISSLCLEESIFPAQTQKHPELYWIDPANQEEILSVLQFKKSVGIKRKTSPVTDVSLASMIDFEENALGQISFYPVGYPRFGQHVVKAYAERQVLLHDLTKSPQSRLRLFMKRNGIDRESKIPILT
nr:YcaO-like family protein [uncultured Hyphomonas sp.]